MLPKKATNTIEWILNLSVLISSLAIVVNVSYDILTVGVYNPHSTSMLTIQVWVCSIFLLDFIVRLLISEHKLHFISRNFMLLIFSVPYLNIVGHLGIPLAEHRYYLLGLIPLLRAGYGLIIILRWIYGRSATTLLAAYLSMLTAMVYFSSLLFYVAERGVNPDVKHWTDAMWWALMDMNTVGSNIIAVTPIGRILSVILGCAGIMVLPIFTVYITQKMSQRMSQISAARKAEDNTTEQK